MEDGMKEMGNDGEIKGEPDWVEGKFGSGLATDCAGCWVEVTDGNILESLHATNTITMAGWLRSTNPLIVIVGISGCCLTSNRGPVGILLENTIGWKYGKTGPVSGDWNHYAATYDGEKVRLYLNGNLDNSIDTGGALPPGGGTLYMGTLPFFST